MIGKIILTYIVTILVVANAYALAIQAGVALREIHSDTSTVLRNTIGTWDVIAQSFVEPYSGGICVIDAYELGYRTCAMPNITSDDFYVGYDVTTDATVIQSRYKASYAR